MTLLCVPWSAAAQEDDPSIGVGEVASLAEEPCEEPLGSTLDCPEGDADRDGVCDTIERSTGTKPLRADTDGDGVPDGIEDRNQDGRVDAGETDPRVPGLFPGSYPHIPEPMVFDLVRGLGAKRGEVEANTLTVVDFARKRRPTVYWAPEIEWAFLDGMAIEFELPMHDRELEALKTAFQVTLPSPRKRFTHGVQAIGEYLLTPRALELTALYVVGGRFGPGSALLIAGARAEAPTEGRHHYQALVNPSVYVDLNERLTLGMESNVRLGFAGERSGTLTPQAHFQITRAVRLQVGGGVHVGAGQVAPQVISRFILEE